MIVESVLLNLFKMSPLLLSEFLAIYKATGYVFDNIQLYKETRPIKINSVKKNDTNSIKAKEKDFILSHLENEVISPQIELFSSVMIDNFSSDNLSSFYNNILNLKVNYQEYHEGNSICKISGSYIVNENTINVTDISTEGVIYHELFHLASSFVDGDNLHSGFSQNSKSGVIGVGINEGYTEVLTNRYFNVVDNNAYPFERYAVSKLEQVVGKELMESLYLNADLYGLINELGQYMKFEDIMKFIANMDFLTKHLSVDKKKRIENKIIKKSLKEVNSFLLDVCSNKLLLLLNEGLISINQLKDCLLYYVNSIVIYERFSDRGYDIFSVEDINAYFDRVIQKAELISIKEEGYKIKKK